MKHQLLQKTLPAAAVPAEAQPGGLQTREPAPASWTEEDRKALSASHLIREIFQAPPSPETNMQIVCLCKLSQRSECVLTLVLEVHVLERKGEGSFE